MRHKNLGYPAAASTLFFTSLAQASLLSGEALDTAADVISWIALVLAPIIAIVVFLMVHILPEKIAEKRHHPQLSAIKTLCLLSLVFGGMLWPLAWLWAYSRPVFYKLAYGTDVNEHQAALSKANEQHDVDAAPVNAKSAENITKN